VNEMGTHSETEEKRARLVRYIKNHDYFVTVNHCAEVYGCTKPHVRQVIKDLQRRRRLRKSFKPLTTHGGSPFLRHFRLIPTIVNFERQGMPAYEMADRLGLTEKEINSIKQSLRKHGHPGFLEAVKLKKQWVQKNKKTQYWHKTVKRFNRELKASLGLTLKETNDRNTAYFFRDILTVLVQGPAVGDFKRNFGITKGEHKAIQRAGLIEKKTHDETRITEKGLRLLKEIRQLPLQFTLEPVQEAEVA